MAATELSRCTGGCCKAFYLPQSPEEFKIDYDMAVAHRADQSKPTPRWEQIEIIQPMLIFIGIGTWDSKEEVFQPLSLADGGTYQYTCKHFDKATGNCGNYEGRPSMCKRYPDGGECKYAGCTRKVECQGKSFDQIEKEIMAMPSVVNLAEAMEAQ